MKKKEVLIIFKLPPPVNGATTINDSIFHSNTIKKYYQTYFIDYGLANSSRDFGSFNLRKVFKYVRALFKLFIIFFIKKIDLVYITIAPKKIAFIKDSLFVNLIKISKKPIIIHFHGKGINEYGHTNRFLNWYYRYTLKGVYSICLSDSLRSDIESFVNKPIFIVKNGIKEESAGLINRNDDSLKLLYLSNFHPTKGVIDFIKALGILKENNLSFRADIIGNYTKQISYRELNYLIKTLSLENFINHVGPKYGKEKVLSLNSSDIFVFPTKYANEAMPLVILEAMQAGLAIISTNNGSIPEMVEDEINGFIISGDLPEKIAKKIAFLYNNREVLKKMKNANIQKFKSNYTEEIMISSLIQSFNEVLNYKTN